MNNRPVVLSLREIYLWLDQELMTYLNKTTWRDPVYLAKGPANKSKFFTKMSRDGDLAAYILLAVLSDLVAETQTDLRNAGLMAITENVLVQHFVDAQSAHAIAENLFAHVVNTLGEHLPDITFNNHTDYRYQLSGSDLTIWKSV